MFFFFLFKSIIRHDVKNSHFCNEYFEECLLKWKCSNVVHSWSPCGVRQVQVWQKHQGSTSHPLPTAPPALLAWALRDVQMYSAFSSIPQLFHKVRRELVGMLSHADHKIQAINASFLIPVFSQGNPEQDTNILSDFTSFPFCFFQHNHIHWFLLVCRSCLQLETQNTIYFLYGFLIWKWI